jgi:hypothetical protein
LKSVFAGLNAVESNLCSTLFLSLLGRRLALLKNIHSCPIKALEGLDQRLVVVGEQSGDK